MIYYRSQAIWQAINQGALVFTTPGYETGWVGRPFIKTVARLIAEEKLSVGDRPHWKVGEEVENGRTG